MKARRVACVVVVASLLAIQVACIKDETVCTPESSGFGGQARVTFTELAAAIEKPACDPRLTLAHDEAELKAAYTQAGIHLLGDADGGNAASAVALPAVDWKHQVVLVREALDDQSISWIVTQGGALTVGTQGCAGLGTGTCRLQFFAVETKATSATGHACPNIGCGGAPQSTPPS